MTDPTPQDLLPKRVRINLVCITVMFCLSLIAFLIAKGSPTNSLHESALAWAFVMVGAVLAGLGFGAVAPLLANLRMK